MDGVSESSGHSFSSIALDIAFFSPRPLIGIWYLPYHLAIASVCVGSSCGSCFFTSYWSFELGAGTRVRRHPRIHCTHTIQRFRTSTIVSHLVFLCKRDRARLVLVCLSGVAHLVILESRRNWCLGIVLHDCHACILATTVPLPNAWSLCFICAVAHE